MADELKLTIRGDSTEGQQAVKALGDALSTVASQADAVAATANRAFAETGTAAQQAGEQIKSTAGAGTEQTSAFMKALDDLLPSTNRVGSAFTDLKGTLTDVWENPKEAVSSLVSGLADDLTPALGAVGVAAAAAAAVVAVFGAAAYEAASNAAEVGESIHDSALKMGDSVEAVSALKGAAEIAGGSIDRISNAIVMFQRNMTNGTQTFTDGMQLIGLSVEDVQALAPSQQFLAIATAIQSIQDPAQRSAAAMDLFGRQGRDLLPLLMKPLAELTDQAKQLGAVWSDEDAKAAEEFEMRVRALRLELEQVWLGIGKDLLPILQFLADHARDVGKQFVKGADDGQAWSVMMAGFGQASDTAHAALALLGLEAAGLPDKFAKLGAATGEAKQKLADLFDKAHSPEKVLAAWQTWAHTVGMITPVVTGVKLAEKDLEEQHKKIEEAAKKAAEAQKAWNVLLTEFDSVGESTMDTISRISADVVAGTQYYLAHGMAVEKVAKFYDLTVEQVKAIQREMKFEDSVVAATTKTFGDHLQILGLVAARYGDLHGALTGLQPDGKTLYSETLPSISGALENLGEDTDYAAQQTKGLEEKLTELRSAGDTDWIHDLGSAIEDVFSQFPHLIERAMTGGGGVSGALKAAGSMIGKDLGQDISDSIGESIYERTGEQASGIVGGLLKSLPVIGSLLGPALSALFNIGGPSKAELAGRQTEAQFESSMGGWQGIQKALLDTGMAADQVNAHLQALWAAEKEGSAAVKTQIDQINGIISAHAKVTADGVQSILDAAKAVGSNFPAALAPMLQQLLTLPGLTDQEKTSLQGLLGTAKPTFDQMISDAQQFGVSLDALGPAFQQAKVSEQADKIVQVFGELKDNGADVGGVLQGMSKKIADLVSEALKYGSTLPTALQPLVQNLLDTGQLVDSTGKKITDVSQLKFADQGDPLADGMNKLQQTLQNLIDVLTNKLPNAAQTAAQKMGQALGNLTFDANVRFNTDVGQVPFAAEGGLVTTTGIVKYFDQGGLVTPTSIVQYLDAGGFIPRGTDTVPAMLTPGEIVLPKPISDELLTHLNAPPTFAVPSLPTMPFHADAPTEDAGSLTINLALDSKIVTTAVIHNVRFNKNSALTMMRAALGGR